MNAPAHELEMGQHTLTGLLTGWSSVLVGSSEPPPSSPPSVVAVRACGPPSPLCNFRSSPSLSTPPARARLRRFRCGAPRLLLLHVRPRSKRLLRQHRREPGSCPARRAFFGRRRRVRADAGRCAPAPLSDRTAFSWAAQESRGRRPASSSSSIDRPCQSREQADYPAKLGILAVRDRKPPASPVGRASPLHQRIEDLALADPWRARLFFIACPCSCCFLRARENWVGGDDVAQVPFFFSVHSRHSLRRVRFGGSALCYRLIGVLLGTREGSISRCDRRGPVKRR